MSLMASYQSIKELKKTASEATELKTKLKGQSAQPKQSLGGKKTEVEGQEQ